MQGMFVLVVSGVDRPGLVNELSRVIGDYQGNWGISHMMHVGGRFAGVIQVFIPHDHITAFQDGLKRLQQDHGLKVLLEQANVAAGDPPVRLRLTVLGQDRPGIVRDITACLAALSVSVERISSEHRSAPMSGEPLFFADLLLSLPAGTSHHEVAGALEALSDQLMVDVVVDSDPIISPGGV